LTAPRRLLTIGHSYAVALNRRLADEIARTGGWEVTVAAPEFVRGDLRPVHLEKSGSEVCRVEPVRASFTGRPHFMLYGRRLRELLRDRWDLVHCWQEPYVLSGLQVARWAGKAPLLYYTFQNLSKRYPPPFNWIERTCIQRSAGWIAAGQTVRDTLIHRPGYADRPHAILPLGVDLSRFKTDPAAREAVRKQLGWTTEGPPVIGFLGRFVSEKGLDLLSRVLDRLTTPWRALLVGSGPLEEELRSWADRHGGRARIATGVTHDQVPAYLNAMDLLAAPSQTTHRWREQFGRMLIEAFACRVPVVGSDSGEIPHVIGDAGIVVGEADEAGWTAALAGLLESPVRRAELASRGRARVEAEFAWPVVARRHIEFFEELLDVRR
jgi:glycosyltransferase involved in cell wall biosynthesis